MKLRILGAVALVLSATGQAQADDRTAGIASSFRAITKGACGFNMTPASAIKAVTTLGMSDLREPLLPAMLAVCAEEIKGNKSKTIEIRVPDNRKVMRKVTLERAKWWQ
ncbi:hypothetical protein K6M90_24315 [Rhizobium sp. 9T]|uniref:Uncharacterized protein n=1 Tax=Rhizobium croatiense TaxID=2867516 RepID=A0ABS7M389_9HYPH|nr:MULTISPECIES: hypothetical protein [Rhizobium]MBY4610770.1 hypothetical protein [Rhizobium croatiense]MBY4631536.1 hypothetical protein [Rhizobium croatiense]PDV86830.1 hypothetical protein CO652_19450 [Rhizobium sp. H4]